MLGQVMWRRALAQGAWQRGNLLGRLVYNWFLAKVRDSRWLKQNCHERVRVANSKILFNQWRNEHPSRYRLGHNLTFTNFGQEPTFVTIEHFWEMTGGMIT